MSFFLSNPGANGAWVFLGEYPWSATQSSTMSTGFSSVYKAYMVLISLESDAADSADYTLQVNGDSNASYNMLFAPANGGTAFTQTLAGTYWSICPRGTNAQIFCSGMIIVYNKSRQSGMFMTANIAWGNGQKCLYNGSWGSGTTCTSLVLKSINAAAGLTNSSGYVRVYGLT